MKRQSSTNELPEPTYFADRDLGKRFVQILRDAGLKVESLEDHFADNTPDTEWLAEVGSKGWVVFTGDKSIGRNELEIDTFMRAKVRAFLPGNRMKPDEFAALIIRAQDKIKRFIKKNEKNRRAGCFAKIRPRENSPIKPPSIETWIDEERWTQIKSQRKAR